MQSIYLDHNATTPILPEVADAVRECQLRHGANAASQHAAGRAARRALEDAREQIAEVLGARLSGPNPDRVVFTSGGSEANNLALRGGVASPRTRPPGRVVISSIEHPSVVGAADYLAHCGWRISRLPVDSRGVVCLDAVAEELDGQTALVSVMLGNNETGAIQPVREIAEISGRDGVPVHTDAVQAVGKIPVNFNNLGVATMTCAAHKFHGPLGIGALVIRGDYPISPILFGGFQQGSLRPGTQPVALVVGMALALGIWHNDHTALQRQLSLRRDRLESQLLAGWASAVIHSVEAERLPHTTNISFSGLDRQALLVALDQAGVACSTGSACASGSSEPSPSLLAMGLDQKLVHSSIRLSLGRMTTDAEVDEAARRILSVVNDLQRVSQSRNSPMRPPARQANPLQ